MLFNPGLIDDNLVGVVQDMDGIIAHDKFGRLLLLKEQCR